MDVLQAGRLILPLQHKVLTAGFYKTLLSRYEAVRVADLPANFVHECG